MKNLPQLPNIPEEEQTPLVKTLLALLEQYSTRIVLLEETVEGLKDEINNLKGEKNRPNSSPANWINQPTKNRVAPGTRRRNGQDQTSGQRPLS